MFGFVIVKRPAVAILFDQLVESVKVSKHMNASATVQMRWLKKPQIKAVKVAQWHRVFLAQPFVKIKSLELGVIWCFSSAALRMVAYTYVV